jgi:hypothetical protein
MSRQNKVNPGMYTQKGRLAPDDTARELKRQRDAAPPDRAREKAPAARPRVTEKDKDAEEEDEQE